MRTPIWKQTTATTVREMEKNQVKAQAKGVK
ncbi:hypothetical protein SDC9_204490 [bioreactor metagenome]|uniref:Uncharacterized protein n=1 Tax=bioreactor metagenome TaxID=1076179 RepID=A0A645IZE5_9ZZZZ